MKYRKEIFVFLFYTLLAIVFTYPLVFQFNSSIYGYPGDNFSTIWHRWWVQYAHDHHLDPRYTPFLNAPFGKDLGTLMDTATFYVSSFALLTSLFNEIFAYNLIIFLSFPLAALTMYFLVKHLTKNSWAAILAGIIFSFSPYHFWKAYNHADLASIQWLPLYVLSLIKLFEKRNYRWAFLTAASFTLAALTSFYYGYFMILFTVGLVVVYLVSYRTSGLPAKACGFRRWQAGRHTDMNSGFDLKMVKVLLLTGVLAAALVLPFTYRLFLTAFSPAAAEPAAGRAAGVLSTTTDELLALSSRPWDFLLPSGHHPIFGKYVDQFYGWLARTGNDFKTQSAFSWERSIYVGWVGILLSLYALKNHRKNKEVLIFAVLAILMVWVSCPAFINIRGHRLYFPSYFLHKFAPMFRTYVRLGVVVLLCVAVLAGFGLSFIFNRIKNKNRFYFCFLLFAFLILFDFTNIPPFRYTEIPTPAVYQWLKEQPGDFIIAEYPQPYSESEAMFFQRIHQKRMVAVGEDLANLCDLQIVGKLRDLGVKYVVVHVKNIFPTDPYNGNREYQVMSPPRETEKFRIVEQFDEALVYDIE